MKAMEIGDLGFFYHSVIEKRIVGIVRVSQKWHLDPTDPTGRFGMVTVVAVKEVEKPVTLSEIKSELTLYFGECNRFFYLFYSNYRYHTKASCRVSRV